MKDSLGRFWKVSSKDGGLRFVCYRVNSGADGKTTSHSVLAEYPDLAIKSGVHNSRVRPGGKACGGLVYGPPGFRICGKCAAEVKD